MEIQWKRGSRFKCDPDKAFDECERIRAKHGGDLDAQSVVDAARAKRSPLHDEFEWDDTKAANEHRKSTARVLISSIVVRRDETTSDEPVKMYSVTRTEKTDDKPAGKTYRSLEEILQDPVARAELLQKALRELVSLQRKYRSLQELAVVWREVERVLEEG